MVEAGVGACRLLRSLGRDLQEGARERGKKPSKVHNRGGPVSIQHWELQRVKGSMELISTLVRPTVCSGL